MRTIQLTCAVVLLLGAPLAIGQTVRPPSQAVWDKATADVTGLDTAAQDKAVEQIRTWIAGGWVSRDLWVKWLPPLVKANKHQAVADLSRAGLLGRPNPDAVTPLMEFRVRALIALNKNDEALQAAKSFYNVCDIKATSRAVDLVGQCLARAHPDDPEIVRRFRAEQAAASTGKPNAGDAMLKAVTIDPAPYEPALAAIRGSTKFANRIAYGNLLLISDQSDEALKLFRELFQLATSPDELTTATEGIAKSLRAVDGNVARANAWLTSLQATQAAQAMAARPAASRGAGARVDLP